ncbi:MAG: hypothetical protein HY260_17650 [Chloroflexi bacterium]|nr:hypothetical protein [Chloroflexota bacterium]
MKRIIPTAIAVAVGIVTLLGYFIDRGEFKVPQLVLLNWATTLAAVALLVGIVNLLRVHAAKVGASNVNSFYSLLLLLTFFGVVGVGFWLGPAGAPARWVFRYLIAPTEAAVGALLFFFLVFAGYRLLRVPRSPWWAAPVFVVVALIVLIGLAPLTIPGTEALGGIHNWIVQVPAAAGARGILLGVALGVIATGLRVLLAADRPYGD